MEKLSSSPHLIIRNWNEFKRCIVRAMDCWGLTDYTKLYLVINIDLTTFTYSKYGDKTDTIYRFLSEDEKYHKWGSEVIVDKEKKSKRSVVFMDEHVKETYDFFAERKTNLTFITTRSFIEKQRLLDEFVALGINNPDILHVGTKSKVDSFLNNRYKPKSKDSTMIEIGKFGKFEKFTKSLELAPKYICGTRVIVFDSEQIHLDKFNEKLSPFWSDGFYLLHYMPLYTC
jgi:hypothetical protein